MTTPYGSGPSAPAEDARRPATDDAVPETAEEADGDRHPPSSSWRTRVPWTLAIVAAGVAATMAFLWLDLRGDAADERAVNQVASDTIISLTNWDAGELDEVRAHIAELGTERLQDEAALILDELAEALTAARARSSGEILDLVSEVSSAVDDAGITVDEGVSFALVRQEVESEELGTVTTTCWSVRVLSIVRDARWLADQIDIFEGQCPGGA